MLTGRNQLQFVFFAGRCRWCGRKLPLDGQHKCLIYGLRTRAVMVTAQLPWMFPLL